MIIADAMTVDTSILATMLGIILSGVVGLQAWTLISVVALKAEMAALKTKVTDLPCLKNGCNDRTRKRK